MKQGITPAPDHTSVPLSLSSSIHSINALGQVPAGSDANVGAVWTESPLCRDCFPGPPQLLGAVWTESPAGQGLFPLDPPPTPGAELTLPTHSGHVTSEGTCEPPGAPTSAGPCDKKPENKARKSCRRATPTQLQGTGPLYGRARSWPDGPPGARRPVSILSANVC